MYVCTKCFPEIDKGIGSFIDNNASSNVCSFCSSEGKDPIAVSLRDLGDFMRECLESEYDDAANWLPYESAEGGFQGTTWDTYDLIYDHLQVDVESDELRSALLDAIGDQIWCERNPFSLSLEDTLMFSWKDFRRLIKYQRRFFFHNFDFGKESFSPINLFEEIYNWCDRLDLLRIIDSGKKVYRVRLQDPGEELRTAAQLGPPPPRLCTQANRMNPPGIPMLYAAFEPETALRETANTPGDYVIGSFKIKRNIKIF